MKTDMQIQKDVMEELRWAPLLNGSEIGVSVKNGIVTLSGTVDSFFKKVSAEKAAKKIAGVKAIAEDIEVSISPLHIKNDTEIATAVVKALGWHSAVPEDKIKVNVENGIVKLEGEVDWDFQRTNARAVVENLDGVISVMNLITVKPKISPADVGQKINAAFQRNASLDARKITVDVYGSKVILHGKVRSIAEKEDAETAAWNAPGVFSVESNLQVEEPEYAFED